MNEDRAERVMREGGGEAEEAPPRALAAVAHVLERLVARNDSLLAAAAGVVEQDQEEGNGGRRRRGSGGLGAFRAAKGPPSIGIGDYLERIQRYTECSPACLVVGYVYIDRAAHRRPDSLVVSLNVHRLIVTSVLIASKVLDDVHHNNAFFARVGGVSNVELNRLELEMLFLLDFEVAVNSRVFDCYCMHLEKEMVWSGIGQKVERAIPDYVNIEIEKHADEKKLAGKEPLQLRRLRALNMSFEFLE